MKTPKHLNETIIDLFTPGSEGYDEEKQWKLIEHLQENEDEIKNYLNEFVFLLNFVYMENDYDCELELFCEQVEPELLTSIVLTSFEEMEPIKPIFEWGNFLFDDLCISHTLKAGLLFENKRSLLAYTNRFKGEVKGLNDRKFRNTVRLSMMLEQNIGGTTDK